MTLRWLGISKHESLRDKVNMWRHFMLASPPPPAKPAAPPEEWDPFGGDYALSKLGATRGGRGGGVKKRSRTP